MNDQETIGGTKARVHELIASPNNVHWGYFSAALRPALAIDPGEIVLIEDVVAIEHGPCLVAGEQHRGFLSFVLIVSEDADAREMYGN